MKIRPLGDNVFVERLQAETRTSGGIVLPDTAREKPKKGKVVNIGEGKKNEDGSVAPMEVKKGDVVLFKDFAGTDLKADGKEYLILNQSDIMAIIEN